MVTEPARFYGDAQLQWRSNALVMAREGRRHSRAGAREEMQIVRSRPASAPRTLPLPLTAGESRLGRWQMSCTEANHGFLRRLPAAGGHHAAIRQLVCR